SPARATSGPPRHRRRLRRASPGAPGHPSRADRFARRGAIAATPDLSRSPGDPTVLDSKRVSMTESGHSSGRISVDGPADPHRHELTASSGLNPEEGGHRAHPREDISQKPRPGRTVPGLTPPRSSSLLAEIVTGPAGCSWSSPQNSLPDQRPNPP